MVAPVAGLIIGAALRAGAKKAGTKAGKAVVTSIKGSKSGAAYATSEAKKAAAAKAVDAAKLASAKAASANARGLKAANKPKMVKKAAKSK